MILKFRYAGDRLITEIIATYLKTEIKIKDIVLSFRSVFLMKSCALVGAGLFFIMTKR